ncbi:MAG: D-amino-acid transaminase [Sphingomonadales bacterium]
MSRIAYVDGRYVPHFAAAVHIEDRGYQFADAVYEVCAVWGGEIVDFDPHVRRLRRSLNELRIPFTMGSPALWAIMRETVRRNRINNGIVYLQISRGQARRDHGFPRAAHPVLVVTARDISFDSIEARAKQGVAVVSTPDIRWRRCDIKSVSLLPNILAKQIARDAEAFEAWFVDDDGAVTEGTSTNAWIVDKKGNLTTRYLDNAILGGITREVVLDIAGRTGLGLVERAFTIDEAKTAREAFVTSTTSLVLPVTMIDGELIADGKPGPISSKLFDGYKHRLASMT